MKDGLLEDLPLPCVLDGLLNDVVHSGQDWRWHGIIFNTAEMCYLPLVRDALVWINQARQANTSVRSSKNSTNSFLRILAKTTLIQIKSKQLQQITRTMCPELLIYLKTKCETEIVHKLCKLPVKSGGGWCGGKMGESKLSMTSYPWSNK